jgi:hypothetical protein
MATAVTRGAGLCLALLLWAMAPPSAAQFTPDLALARRLFVEVERVARLPSRQQATHLPRLYREVCPQLNQMFVAHTLMAPAPAARERETPTQAANRIEGVGGWPALADAGRRRCRELMTSHRSAAEALALEDLRDGSNRDQTRALHMIGELRAIRLFDAVVAALRMPEPIFAAQALRTLDDPRAIAPLIHRFPEEPTRFFDILRSLQRNRPAHPLLLELLRSKDTQVRWQAAHALTESRDPALIPIIEGLVSDPAADVRRQAGQIALSFDDSGYRRARPLMIPLLSDADIGVRADVAVAMASRMDRVSAPILLALLPHVDTLEPWRQSNVIQAVHTLTGTYFGLTPGTPLPPPVRDKAMADFAEWIKANPP